VPYAGPQKCIASKEVSQNTFYSRLDASPAPRSANVFESLGGMLDISEVAGSWALLSIASML
jgi:hypothetical protein